MLMTKRRFSNKLELRVRFESDDGAAISPTRQFMAVSKKVRIYDLARELKQDTKRIVEDLRREGSDVSVPSNSVPQELADKVRNKYFPQVDKTPKRAIKVIKRKAIVMKARLSLRMKMRSPK